MSEPKLLKWARILVGLVLILFGINTFVPFMPQPVFNEAGGAFIGALFASSYIFPIIGIIFLLVGVLFVWGKYKPFAALLLIPITFNIAMFHLVLNFNGSALGLIIFLINIWMLWAYRTKYESLFS